MTALEVLQTQAWAAPTRPNQKGAARPTSMEQAV
jgi:hypothetical protein